MTNPTTHRQVPAIQRYKIGYHSDEWGVRSSTPGGISDPSGQWVLYKDYIAALVEAQQPAPSGAVALSDYLRDRLVAISEAIADQDDRAAQAMLREILAAPQPSPAAQGDALQPVVALQEIAGMYADDFKPQADSQPALQQEPSHTAVRLAELVLSDCGHSSNYTPLLDRVAARIDAHVERRLDELRGCLESKLAPSPAAQVDALDAARYRYLRDCNSGSLVVMQITGTGEDDWHTLTEDAADAAIDAARAAQEGK